MRLNEKAKALSSRLFLGGPPEIFESAGRMQLSLLLHEGLYPQSKVLDVGCGCLRAGYWLIHFLDPRSYFGIEPNQAMLQAGIENFLEPDLLDTKKPQFRNNADFDFSVFNERRFDFVLARSIWTHASKGQISKMLDGFKSHGDRESVFLASYYAPSPTRPDYQGTEWVGKSHESDAVAPMIAHSFEWIQNACAERGLAVQQLNDSAHELSDQTWLRIKLKAEATG